MLVLRCRWSREIGDWFIGWCFFGVKYAGACGDLGSASITPSQMGYTYSACSKSQLLFFFISNETHCWWNIWKPTELPIFPLGFFQSLMRYLISEHVEWLLCQHDLIHNHISSCHSAQLARPSKAHICPSIHPCPSVHPLRYPHHPFTPLHLPTIPSYPPESIHALAPS